MNCQVHLCSWGFVFFFFPLFLKHSKGNESHINIGWHVYSWFGFVLNFDSYFRYPAIPNSLSLFFFFFLILLFRAALVASLYHSHSSVGRSSSWCVIELHHSSRQRRILNPLSKARDQTRILMDTCQVHYCWATKGIP